MAGKRGSRRPSAGALAGWLFADLALVLAFVFLDSNTAGLAGSGSSGTDVPAPTSTVVTTTTSSTTTTTTVVGPTTTIGGGGGARPEPYTVTVRADAKESVDTLIARLEEALAGTDAANEPEDGVYLVVIVHGGSRGVARSVGNRLSKWVADTLETNWSRVVEGTTYFTTGDDNSVAPGAVVLSLFPATRSMP